MDDSSHQPLVTQVAVEMECHDPPVVPASSSSSPSSSSSSSPSSDVILPSSLGIWHIFASFVIPILATVVLAIRGHDATIFLAPTMALVAVLFWIYLWLGWLNRGSSIFSINGSNPRPPVDVMSTQPLLSLILTRFTYGFWVSGSISLILCSIALVVIPHIYPDVTPQGAAWFVLGIISINLALYHWVVVYLFSLKHVRMNDTHTTPSTITCTQINQQAISVTALSMGSTMAQLWYGFTIFSFRLDWFQLSARVNMPSDVLEHSAWLILMALVVSMTLLPLDMRGSQHLVLGMIAKNMNDAAVGRGTGTGTIGHDRVSSSSSSSSSSAIRYHVLGIDYLGVPIILRFVLIYGCFWCLIGMWNAMNEPYVAILVYVIVATLFCYLQTRAGKVMRSAILQRCNTSQPQPHQQP